MKRMLINATQEEELRMAMVDGQRLFDLNIEGPASERKKANIYKGKITRVEPSLEAAFVDYGAERHGFLPLKEVSSEYFISPVDSGKKPNIKDVLKDGQDIVVQIDKEERGNKGAALTTFVSLAGRFIVLKPNKSQSGGVSRRIVGDDRDDAKKSLNDIDIPDGMSVILRTAGIDRSAEELTWDIETLMQVWQAILDHVLNKPAPFLLYRESNAVARALRDYLSNDIGEILIDDEATYNEAVEQVTNVMPHNLKKLKHYQDPVPLFTRFQVETQIESAFAHSVTLPAGGSIVIDHTEAMVSIDINSARATKGSDIEATALNTNLEAAEEIARQLRIRDLGGLVVIDFIDMGPQKNQRDVENRLRDAVRQDRARVQIGKISRFGLLEMSRQRLRPSLGESSYHTCPRCSGFGTIRSVESLALAILRIIGEEARKERTAKVIAQLPVEVATYLLNEKRGWVQSLETRNDTQVVLVANSALETPHYDIRRVRDDQTEMPENAGVSYELAEADPEPEAPPSIQERKAAEQAAIDVIKPATPAPKRKKSGGVLAWLAGVFSSDDETSEKKPHTRGRRSGGSQSRRRRNAPQRGRKRNDQRQQGSSKTQRPKKKSPQQKQDENKGRRPQAKDKDKDKDQKRPKQAQPQAGQKQDEARDETKKPSRGRRSRGGRRRRRSTERPPQNAVTETQEQDKQVDQQQDVAEKPQREPKAKTDKARDAAPPSAKPEKVSDAGSPDAKAEKAADAESPDAKPEKVAYAGLPDAKPEKAADAGSPDAKPEKAADSAPASVKPDKAEDSAPAQPRADKERDAGPPRVRTDAERAADAASTSEYDKTVMIRTIVGLPEGEVAPEPKPKADVDDAVSDAKAKPKSEAKPTSAAKPKPKVKPKVKPKPRADKKPKDEAKSESDAKAETESKSNGADEKPKEKSGQDQEQKPEGRLLPWDSAE